MTREITLAQKGMIVDRLTPVSAAAEGRRLMPKLHGHWPTPDDASLHRQANRIVMAIPTEEGLEVIIELLSLPRLQPRPREAVSGMEGLDVVIGCLGIYHDIGLRSPADCEQPSRLELRHSVVRHVVSVGTVVPNEDSQLWVPQRRLGQRAFHEDEMTGGNQARPDAGQDAVPVEPVKGLSRNDGGIPTVEGVVFCGDGKPLDVIMPGAGATEASLEHRAGRLDSDEVVDERRETDREVTCARTNLKNKSRVCAEQGLKDDECLWRVWRPAAVRCRDLFIAKLSSVLSREVAGLGSVHLRQSLSM